MVLNGRGALFGAGLASIILLSCPRTPDPPDGGSADAASAHDTGHDAAVSDSGHDAPSDRDVVPDTNVDAGPTDPVWTPLPGLPSGCVIERAAHPERLPGLRWTSCGTGCLRADREMYRDQVQLGAGYFTDGRGWIATASFTADPTRDMHAIMPVDGPPIAAWRFPHVRTPVGCWVGWGAVGGGRAGAVAHWNSAGFATVEERLYLSSIETLAASDTPSVILTAPDVGAGLYVDHLAIGEDASALEIVPSHDLIIVHGSDVVRPAATGALANIEGDHVVWEDATSLSFWHWTPESGAEIYYPSPDDGYVGFQFVDHGTMVWNHAVGASGNELWTSPFARTPAGVASRRVLADNVPRDARFGDGIYVSVPSNFSAVLTDVADGRQRLLGEPDPSTVCSVVHYVSSTELLVDCTTTTAPPLGVFYRIDPRTLPYVP